MPHAIASHAENPGKDMILLYCDSAAWKTPPACSLRLMDLSRQDLANSVLHSILPYLFLRLYRGLVDSLS